MKYKMKCSEEQQIKTTTRIHIRQKWRRRHGREGEKCVRYDNKAHYFVRMAGPWRGAHIRRPALHGTYRHFDTVDRRSDYVRWLLTWFVGWLFVWRSSKAYFITLFLNYEKVNGAKYLGHELLSSLSLIPFSFLWSSVCCCCFGRCHLFVACWLSSLELRVWQSLWGDQR